MSVEIIPSAHADFDAEAHGNEIYELLHTCQRRENFLTMEEHLMKAARLSRALWEALGNVDLGVETRTRVGLQCLASEVADHASAADVLFRLDSMLRSGSK
jgi:hypothetical protein